MGVAHMCTLMEPITKVNGGRTNSMGMDSSCGLTVQLTREDIGEARSTGLEDSLMLMVACMKANSHRTRSTVMAATDGWTARFTRAIGATTGWTAVAPFAGETGELTSGSSEQTNERDSAPSLGRMEIRTSDNGRVPNSMERVCYTPQVVTIVEACGRMGSGSGGCLPPWRLRRPSVPRC